MTLSLVTPLFRTEANVKGFDDSERAEMYGTLRAPAMPRRSLNRMLSWVRKGSFGLSKMRRVRG